jgi:phenylacetate-CoA ligase
MDLWLIAQILRKRRMLRGHERWSRRELEQHQTTALGALRDHAMTRSRFYQRFHRGLEGKPLGELPVLTKSELMASFDELVVDPDIRRADVERHLAALRGNERYLGRYWVSRTAGSTGHPGIFLVDRDEWSTVIASYARAQEWAGIDAKLTRRTRLAVVSSRVPWHQSARVAASIDSPFVPVRRFDSTQPIAEIVAGLNAWQPENLIVYASMSRVLAEEQLAGRLRISPRAVMCSSEVLTAEAIARALRAWGSRPFNVYAATETAAVASECARHRLHLYEDLMIPEIVDERDRPVPAGTAGAKLLVTVLFSRTQPLIRYEMSDRLVLATDTCDCGLPFGGVAAIEGRAEDMLSLPAARGGTISIHPNVFHRVLEVVPAREWQVIQDDAGLRILLGHAGPVAAAQIADGVARELRGAGAIAPPIRVELVDCGAPDPARQGAARRGAAR